MHFNTEWRPYLALLLGVSAIGFSGIFVSWANAPGTVTGFYRVAIATAVLFIPFWRKQRAIRPLPRRAVILALLGGLFFAGDLAFWNSGILISGPTIPTLMGNTAPIWVGLGTMLLFRQRLERPFWLGLGIALLGVVIMVGVDVNNNVGLGSLFGLMAGLFYGAYFLVMQRSREQLDAITSFWFAAFISTITLFLVSLLLHQPLGGYSAQTYLNFLALGLVVQITGQLAINYALGYLPAALVSPTLLGQPVLTAVFSAILLGERFTGLQLWGGTAVLLGVFIVHRAYVRTG